jgi:glutathione synthase/RimK-type ligase-like ATP-grasp enzyme
LIVAIHPDDYTNRQTPEKCDASSPRWAEAIENAGYQVKWVDVYRADILEQLHGCHGFMWRWAHFKDMRRIASRLLPVLERDLGMVVYPDQNTCWHYDDKIAQHYLLAAHGIPMPKTWVWFQSESARQWAETAHYPLVLKLPAGAGATNVRLVHDPAEAVWWIDRLFREGVTSLSDEALRGWCWKKRIIAAGKAILRGQPPVFGPVESNPHKGYALFQEFLDGNDFDTRITVIGNRAFGFRRFNRHGDFRASGSGNIDWTRDGVDPAFVRLAFGTATSLKTQSCAIDGLYRKQAAVVGEISYTYASWAVHACPGHWELEGTPETGKLVWRDGAMWPEEAQAADYLERLRKRHGQ